MLRQFISPCNIHSFQIRAQAAALFFSAIPRALASETLVHRCPNPAQTTRSHNSPQELYDNFYLYVTSISLRSRRCFLDPIPSKNPKIFKGNMYTFSMEFFFELSLQTVANGMEGKCAGLHNFGSDCAALIDPPNGFLPEMPPAAFHLKKRPSAASSKSPKPNRLG